MGGFLGIGGNSAKTDRGETLGAYGNANNIFNYAFPESKSMTAEGRATTSTGLSTMDSIKNYFRDIASGSRAAQTAAVAPEINATIEQADAQRKKEAWFGTGRGGGTNAANAAAETDRMATIDNLMFAARPAAAKAVADIGQAETTVGTNQIAAGLKALGLSDDVISQIMQSSIQSRPISAQINKSTQDQIRNFVAQSLLSATTGGWATKAAGAVRT